MNTLYLQCHPQPPATGQVSSLASLVAARPSRMPASMNQPLMLRGDPAYLRALRKAEMKAWQLSGGDKLLS